MVDMHACRQKLSHLIQGGVSQLPLSDEGFFVTSVPVPAPAFAVAPAKSTNEEIVTAISAPHKTRADRLRGANEAKDALKGDIEAMRDHIRVMEEEIMAIEAV